MDDAEPTPPAVASAVVDGSGKVVAWDDGAEALLGRPAEEVVGRPAAELLAGPVPSGAVGSLAGRSRWNGTLALRHRAGHEVRAHLIAHRRAPEEGGDGWLLVTPLAGRDPRPGEEELAELAFEQTAAAMAIYDEDLRLRRWNGEMARTVGLTEDEARGLRLSEIGGKPQSQDLEQYLARARDTGRRQDLSTFLRAGGERREHAWSAAFTPLRDRSGRLRAICLTATDTTEEYAARKRLAVLNDAAARIGSSLDVTRTAEELAEVCVPFLADLITVDLLEAPVVGHPTEPWNQPLRRVAQRSVLPGCPEALVRTGTLTRYSEHAPQSHALRAGHSLRYAVDDPALRPWFAERPDRLAQVHGFGIHSVMLAPILARGITLGVAMFARHRRPEPFVHDDVLLAEEIAARAAVCVDNARRYTREREVALTLQRNLLPRVLPTPTAVATASRYLPAGPHTGVGGDWFDVIPLSGARVALVVGDVVGHGVQASATMGRLRTAVRTLADVDLPPDELLTHLDDLVVRLAMETGDHEAGGDVGATCLYAVYDPVSRICQLARAGHPPPVLLPPGGEPEVLRVPAGPPLGVGGLPFEAVERELPEHSLLALCTDGLLESRERDIDAGFELLRDVLGRHRRDPLESLCDTVLDALLPTGGALDDVALLVARTRALSADRTAYWDVPAIPASVGEVRDRVRQRLADWGLAEAEILTSELITSELVTNAIRHASPPIRLRLILDKALICEVCDASSTAPHLRRARSLDETGRGLMLVAQLARRWGSRHTPNGKIIWAELPVPDSVSVPSVA
ncbi:SpoIIE family protein phosphatase [Streptomyces hainanensis]|uniref:PAS domain S-box protein n=1 Tax=Streptomyces hainanensis TaxID=402648 RepID=A0A4R4THR7_9ACTN|nr:SpoIIE family protein phosphatase [Streptomyces hainanensis]TDC77318.1 PAS domain S-box protein [Streptomyces hainanensis]